MFDRWLDRAASRHVLACLVLVVLTCAAALPGFITLFPMDRDEPRFAQASKQMLESGDLVDIRFQDVARNKKPVGIYWLQAGTVAIGEAIGVPHARTTIWLYRIPSLLGAIAAVLLTYWTALPLTSRKGAVLAGAMMAPALILVVEAHLAKTDAVMLATIVAAMGVLARAFVARAREAPLPVPLAAAFWVAIAAGILVKGPITPMVVLFAAAILAVRDRSGRWLRALRPIAGLALCAALVAPWFVLILKSTGGAFLTESVGHDMGAKIIAGQESHGAPFGAYFAAFWVTAWPFAPFALLAAPIAWRDRRSDQVAFLLAWIVPTWLLFETVPTKLPHYVMPVYPALAILAAASLQKGSGAPAPRGWRLWLFGTGLAVVPVIVSAVVALAPGRIASVVSPTTAALCVFSSLLTAAAIAGAVHFVRQSRWGAAVWAASVAAICVYMFAMGWMLNETNADLLALSPRLAAAGRAAAGPACPDPAFATVGDQEPSLVFLTGTTLLMTDPAGAADFIDKGPCRVAFVARPAEAAFLTAVKGGRTIALASRVAGVNLNGGKPIDIGVYVTREGAT